MIWVYLVARITIVPNFAIRNSSLPSLIFFPDNNLVNASLLQIIKKQMKGLFVRTLFEKESMHIMYKVLVLIENIRTASANISISLI